MTIATYFGSAVQHRAFAETEWREVYVFSIFRAVELVDGTYHRGFSSLMRRRNASGSFEFRRLTGREIEAARAFEQAW